MVAYLLVGLHSCRAALHLKGFEQDLRAEHLSETEIEEFVKAVATV